MKNYLVTVGIALAVFVVGMFFVKPAQTVINQVAPGLGAISNPDLNSPYFGFGGVRSWAASTNDLYSASTTLCAMQSPAATSTLVSASLRLEYASTSAAYLEMGNATTKYATTTSLAKMVVAASASGSLIATTSATALTDGIVPPSTWIVVKAGFATAATSATVPSGRCEAVFREI